MADIHDICMIVYKSRDILIPLVYDSVPQNKTRPKQERNTSLSINVYQRALLMTIMSKIAPQNLSTTSLKLTQIIMACYIKNPENPIYE